jgi:rRNA maturation endonuclease Nob1
MALVPFSCIFAGGFSPAKIQRENVRIHTKETPMKNENEKKTAKYKYECTRTTCGYVELTNYAPASTKKCPSCGGMLTRKAL